MNKRQAKKKRFKDKRLVRVAASDPHDHSACEQTDDCRFMAAVEDVVTKINSLAEKKESSC